MVQIVKREFNNDNDGKSNTSQKWQSNAFLHKCFKQITSTYHNIPNRSFADYSHQIGLFICCSVKLEKLIVSMSKESSPPIYKLHAPSSFQNALGLGQTSKFFMRRTKLCGLNSWKARRLAQLSLCEWVWIVQHALSVCFRRIEHLKIVPGTNVDLHMRRTKLVN